MSSNKPVTRREAAAWRTLEMIHRGARRLRIASLLLAVLFMSANSVAIAQCEIAKLLASDGTPGDQFGTAVAIHGDTVIVGVPCKADAGHCSGAAYVYRRQGTVWAQEAKLTPLDHSTEDAFGFSVAIDGDVVAVGAVGKDFSEYVHAGAVYMFARVGGGWVQTDKLVAPDVYYQLRFGFAVDLSEETLLVGTPTKQDVRGADVGAGYVYRRTGLTWVHEATLVPSDARNKDEYFGGSVSIDGGVAIIGAAGKDNPLVWTGAAYVFTHTDAGWAQAAKLTASDSDIYDRFGTSVSISGDSVVIGSTGDRVAGGIEAGSAYVFQNSGGSWIEQAKLTASDGAHVDRFGNAVAIDGDDVIVGAFDADGQNVHSGAGYLYRRGDGAWREVAKLLALDGTPCVLLGYSASLDAGTAVLGAPSDRPECLTGGAYIFGVSATDCNANGVPDECDIRTGVSRDADANGIPDECEAGACCDLLTGGCTENIPPSACSGAHQSWTSGARCNDVLCEAVVGACCDHDPFGGCTDGLTRAECDCARCEWTEGALCDDVECPRESIPTVGAWGLAILSLLLLTGAKIRFGRIQQT